MPVLILVKEEGRGWVEKNSLPLNGIVWVLVLDGRKKARTKTGMMLREQLEIFSTKLSIGKPFYAQHVSTACRPCRPCTPLRQHKGHLLSSSLADCGDPGALIFSVT